jgi:hypothetical protein
MTGRNVYIGYPFVSSVPSQMSGRLVVVGLALQVLAVRDSASTCLYFDDLKI